MESQFDRDKTNEHLEVLKRRNVDGVIVFGFTDCDVESLSSWQHKAVVIAMDYPELSSINYDNQMVIELALEHVKSQGLDEIAI